MLNNAALLAMVKKTVKVTQIACSGNTTWYVTKSGELYGCGSGSYSEQGSGSTDNVRTFTKRADNVAQVAQVACSGDDYYNQTTWYVTNSGELYGCGSGSYGQQGNESTANVNTFTKRP